MATSIFSKSLTLLKAGTLSFMGLAASATAAHAISLSNVRIFSDGDCGGTSATQFLIQVVGNAGEFPDQDRLVDFGGGVMQYFDTHHWYVVDANNVIIGTTFGNNFSTNTGVFGDSFFSINQRPTGTGNFTVRLQDEVDGTPDQTVGGTYVAGSTERASLSFNGLALDSSCVPVASMDTTQPVVTVPTNQTVNTDAGLNTAVVTYATVTATDNVAVTSGPALSAGFASGSAFPTGATTVTYTATDAAGNVGTASFTVTVNDNQAPVITPPATQTVDTDTGVDTASLDVTSLGSVSDNVDTGLAITYRVGTTVLSGAYTFPLGDTTVTMDATDAANNAAAQMSFTVTVSDGEAPSITAPANQTANTDAGLNTASLDVTSLGSVSDNVDTGLAITYRVGGTALSGAYTFPLGDTTVTMDATDAANNAAAQMSFTVTVSDNELPVVTVPASQTVNTDPGSNTAVVTYATATAMDNVAVTSGPTLSAGLTSGAAFPVGATTVTYTATDDAGNIGTASFTVTVNDNDAPVITPPVNQAVDTDAGVNTASLDVTSLGSVSDNVDTGLAITYRVGGTALSGAYTFPLGDTTVTMDATDAANNAAVQVSFTVTVSDGEAPVIAAFAPVTLEAGPTGTSNHAFTATVTDNVDLIVTPVFTLNGGVITSPYDFPVGVNNVLVNATDAVGNDAVQQTFVVTVTAAVAPGVPVITTSDINANRSMTIAGTAEADSTVRVTFPDATFQEVVATGGAYSVTSAADMIGGTVSVTATDAADNQSDAATVALFPDYERPTVAITGAPTRVVDTTPFTVSITFSETVTGFDQSDISLTGGDITAFSGSDAAYQAEITPIAGEPTISISIASGVAEDEFTNLNEASAVIEITNDALTETEEMIIKNAASRSRSLIAAQPQLRSFMLGGQRASFDATVTQGAGNFDFSTAGGRSIWAAGQGRWTTEGELESSYANLALGAHLDVTESLLIGAMLQVDSFVSDEGVARFEGTGWLVGPYAVARMAEQPLVFSASYLLGQTDNKISPLGTYEDSFSSDRSILTFGVAGEVNLDVVTLIPLLDFAQAVEENEAYTDGDSNAVRSQKVTTTDATIGLDFVMPLNVSSGAFSLLGGFGITSSSVENIIETTELTTGSTELGFRYLMENGGAISGRAIYDGIGQDDYEAFGAEMLFEISF